MPLGFDRRDLIQNNVKMKAIEEKERKDWKEKKSKKKKTRKIKDKKRIR